MRIYIPVFIGTLLAGFSLLPANISNLPAPYNSLEKILTYDGHGWFTGVNKDELTKLITRYKPKNVVEIGVWLGSSTIYMASILDNDCRLYAVDHFKGSSVHVASTNTIKPRIPILYQQFLSNVIHKNKEYDNDLLSIIVPINNDSVQAAREFTQKADLIYIDGSHLEKDVYNDIMSWYKHLAPGGIMCGDDYNWWYQSHFPVQRALQRAAKELGVTYSVQGNRFWQFPPKK